MVASVRSGRAVHLLAYSVLVGSLLLFGMAELPAAAPAPTIQHVVVIVQENHTFDNFFGFYPGADGLQGSTAPVFHATTNAVYENQSIDGFVGHPENYGYFTCADIPYYCRLADSGVLFDKYFTVSALASLPNHMAIVAGSTLGFHTDWNTSGQAFPWRSNATILDEMDASGVSWGYYDCDYNECPLAFFTQSGGWSSRVAEPDALISQIKHGALPQVSFVMPDSDDDSDQPPGSLAAGQQWVKTVVDDLNSTGYLGSTVVLLTWDDSGGWYDHVVPPGSFGYRVPMIMLAPSGPRGLVDHSVSSHYSIPRVIESVFGLGCMRLDCGAYDLLDSLGSQEALTTTAGSSVVATASTTSSVLTLSSSSSTATASQTSATASASTAPHTTSTTASRSTTTSTHGTAPSTTASATTPSTSSSASDGEPTGSATTSAPGPTDSTTTTLGPGTSSESAASSAIEPATVTQTVTVSAAAVTATRTMASTTTVPASTVTAPATTVIGPTTTETGPATTIVEPGGTMTTVRMLTSTSTVGSSTAPSWAYAAMTALLAVGLAIGYAARRQQAT